MSPVFAEFSQRVTAMNCSTKIPVYGKSFHPMTTTNPFFVRAFYFCAALLLASLLCSVNLRATDMFPDASQLPSHPAAPEPLVMLDGSRVATADQWIKQRRPELKALFQHYMYGAIPDAPKKLDFKVERVDKKFFDGKATKKEITIRFSRDADAPAIHLLEVIPNSHAKGPDARRGFPVFVGLNFCGNHTLVTNEDIALPEEWMAKSCPGCVSNRATDAGRGTQVDVWNIEKSIERGYAVATFYYGDIEPDTTNATTGLRAYLARKGGTSRPDFGAVAAWAWGLSRAADYLVTDKQIDAKRMAVVGHSRLGKAAILAGAFDERFAMVIPLQAGCGGTAPSRGTVGESVEAINTHFPHWYNAEFKKFNQQTDRLPFDQDCLIALVAPRPVLIGAAEEDTWGNPAGVFDMAVAGDPVYRLLAVKGLDADKMPGMNRIVGDRVAYFIRPGKHSMAEVDWDFFWNYADKMMP